MKFFNKPVVNKANVLHLPVYENAYCIYGV